MATFSCDQLKVFSYQGDLLLDNLALRQQILVLRRTNPKPSFSVLDKAFWVVLYRHLKRWRRPLALVKPETVISWHRQGWRLWWKWKSRPKEVGGLHSRYFRKAA